MDTFNDCFFSTSLSLAGNPDRLTQTRQPQEQRYPFLSVCAVFSEEGASSSEIRTGHFSKSVTVWTSLQAMVSLPVFWIFNAPTDVAERCITMQSDSSSYLNSGPILLMHSKSTFSRQAADCNINLWRMSVCFCLPG